MSTVQLPVPPGTGQNISVSSPGRHIAVHVVDANDILITGADILFSIDGIPAGGVRSSAGNASFYTPNSSVTVDISVVVDLRTQSAHLPPGFDTYTFRFVEARAYLAAELPVASCPDGSSGQPCVDCDIGGVFVRICAV